MEVVQPIRDKGKLKQMKEVLKRKSKRDCFLFVLGINTGLRISDMLKLKVSDVKGKIHITIKEMKTKKDKRFKINSNLSLIIDEYIELMAAEDYLFPSRKAKGSIGRVQAYRILSAAAKEVGINSEIGTHTLRKSFGYHFYKQYKDVAMLQQIFNHSSSSVTLRYIGITQDLQDAAIDDFSL